MKYYDASQVARLLAEVRAGRPVDAKLLQVCEAALNRELAILEARAMLYRLRFGTFHAGPRPKVDRRRNVEVD